MGKQSNEHFRGWVVNAVSPHSATQFHFQERGIQGKLEKRNGGAGAMPIGAVGGSVIDWRSK